MSFKVIIELKKWILFIININWTAKDYADVDYLISVIGCEVAKIEIEFSFKTI